VYLSLTTSWNFVLSTIRPLVNYYLTPDAITMAPTTNDDSKAAPPAASHRFDPNFTQHVIDTMGPNVTPRNREVLGALIRHIHDFSREVELTIDEWMAGVHFVNAVGALYESSGRKRNESHRISDVLGLESYVNHPPFSVTSWKIHFQQL
jgi:catechol 1,2-dioxygenase